MDATLHPASTDTPEQPAMVRWGLLGAALAAALLGLTTLDVEPAAKPTTATAAERTTECIVASALFAGVAPAP
ncbi:MAG TPA: hypothetical protein VFZ93_02660 [Albitalea sp.]